MNQMILNAKFDQIKLFEWNSLLVAVRQVFMFLRVEQAVQWNYTPFLFRWLLEQVEFI